MGRLKRMPPQTAASVFTALLKQRGAANQLPEAHQAQAYQQLHGHLLAIFEGLWADHTFIDSDSEQSKLFHQLQDIHNQPAQAGAQPTTPAAAGPAPVPSPVPQAPRPIDGPTPLPPSATGGHGILPHKPHPVPVNAPMMSPQGQPAGKPVMVQPVMANTADAPPSLTEAPAGPPTFD